MSHGPELDPAGGAGGESLSADERQFFVDNGFLVKRQLLAAATLQPFVERVWASLPACIDRANRSTWVDPGSRWDVSGPAMTPGGCPTQRGWPRTYTDTGNVLDYSMGGEPGFVSATSAHPAILEVVEALVGGPLRRPSRNRGTYILFPKTDPGKPGPHHDSIPCDLFAMLYLSDVRPRSGGTIVWPASHRMLYEGLDYEQRHGFSPNAGYAPMLDHIKVNVQPVELVGAAGDVCFFHPSLIHSGGLNHASASGDIRIASPLDFQRARPAGTRPPLMWELGQHPLGTSYNSKAELAKLEDKSVGSLQGALAFGPRRALPDGSFPPPDDEAAPEVDGGRVAKLIWHHDTLEYATPIKPRSDDMWEGWNLGRTAVMHNVVEQPPWWELHGLSIPTPDTRLHELAVFERGLWRLRQ
jgi:hypothetical protein